jgi:type III secretion protein R
MDDRSTAGRRSRRGALLFGAAAALAAVGSGAAVTTLAIEAAQAQPAHRRPPHNEPLLKPAEINSKDSIASRPLILIAALGALSLLPFAIIMVTSFVKISVVLSIVRSALGTQQMPPTQVITGLGLILTVYIMAPVGIEIYRSAQSLIEDRRPGTTILSAETIDLAWQAVIDAKPVVSSWLIKNSHLKDRAMFYSMAKRLRKPEDRSGVGPEDFMVIIPAFVISELKEAFQIGFIIFVPFVVIDMVVSNILMALGMQMLSPTTISLPFKLLLFVVIDGWYLITKGLIMGYI